MRSLKKTLVKHLEEDIHFYIEDKTKFIILPRSIYNFQSTREGALRSTTINNILEQCQRQCADDK
jgi:hypothetical protein